MCQIEFKFNKKKIYGCRDLMNIHLVYTLEKADVTFLFPYSKYNM